MAKSIQIGDKMFKSKKSALDFFRAIRDSYEDSERVHEEHHGQLLDLIAIHPEAETKIGCGIAFFTIETERTFGSTRHFMIHRRDGSETDVSFKSPIKGRNPRRDRLEALRRAVATQVIEFKEIMFSARSVHKCPFTGMKITESSYNVDHEPPNTFHVLVQLWLVLEGMDLLSVEITPSEDNQIVTEMTDQSQRERWTAFHMANAQLRLLSPRGNLSNVNIS